MLDGKIVIGENSKYGVEIIVSFVTVDYIWKRVDKNINEIDIFIYMILYLVSNRII